MLEVMNLQIAPFQTEINTTLAHSTTGNSSTFNLEDSNVHNDIEIDGSLSRKDLYFGDNVHFDHEIWDQSSSKFEEISSLYAQLQSPGHIGLKWPRRQG